MGHVDNIVAMFHREPRYISWTAAILKDEHFNVRLGVSVLFEELQARSTEHLELAIPGLLWLLGSDKPYLRSESSSVLAIIGGPELAGPGKWLPMLIPRFVRLQRILSSQLMKVLSGNNLDRS